MDRNSGTSLQRKKNNRFSMKLTKAVQDCYTDLETIQFGRKVHILGIIFGVHVSFNLATKNNA